MMTWKNASNDGLKRYHVIKILLNGDDRPIEFLFAMEGSILMIFTPTYVPNPLRIVLRPLLISKAIYTVNFFLF